MNNATDAAYNSSKTKLVESTSMKDCDYQAHMDDADEVRPRVYSGRDGEQSSTSTFWLRRLDAAESADPDRLFHP